MYSCGSVPGVVEEGAPRVFPGATVRLWCQPPVLNISRAETGQRGVELEPTGPSGARRGFAVGYLERITIKAGVVVLRGGVAEVGVTEVVTEDHLECRSVEGYGGLGNVG